MVVCMSAGTSSGNPDVPIPFEACDPSGTFVFVSYAHDDKTLVYPELRRIRSFGIRVWYDEGIEPGAEWPEAIATALDGATAFLVMITPGAVASRNVRNEINAALNWGKPVFAVHLAQTALPKGLELQMGAVQAIMRWRMDEDSYARKLGKALVSYAEAENEAPLARPEGDLLVAHSIRDAAVKTASGGSSCIFLNYRRDDLRQSESGGRLYKALLEEFGEERIVTDIDQSGPGDFVKLLDSLVGSCRILLAIIGPGWTDARDWSGQRRLDNSHDFVRIEIESALRRAEVLVIPVLIDGAAMPKRNELPGKLAQLSGLEPIRIGARGFAHDIRILIHVMKQFLVEVD